MSKETIRKELIALRKRIINKKQKSSKVFEALLNLDEYKSAKNILFYHSLSEEVDTTEFLTSKGDAGKNIFLPICRKEEGYELIPSRHEDKNNLRIGDFGVMQPSTLNGSDENIDLVIVPGVGFDTSGNRIGFGKGCYDRYLSKNKNAKRIGISFDKTMQDKIPTEPHDMKMDMIITEKRVIRCS